MLHKHHCQTYVSVDTSNWIVNYTNNGQKIIWSFSYLLLVKLLGMANNLQTLP